MSRLLARRLWPLPLVAWALGCAPDGGRGKSPDAPQPDAGDGAEAPDSGRDPDARAPAADATRDAVSDVRLEAAPEDVTEAGEPDAEPVPYAGPRFTDVTLAAGIDYVQGPVVRDGTCGLIEIAGCAEQMTGGAAAGDYDGDGFVDLYVTRLDAPGILYRNRQDGTFEDVTVLAGLSLDAASNGAGFADIDNDGDLDLYVTSVGGTRFHLFVNDGAGTFTEEGVSRGAALENEHLHNGFSVAFGDYDRDGYVDLHVSEWRYEELVAPDAPSNTRLLRNRGVEAPGHFEDVTESAGVSLVGRHDLGVWAFASSFVDLDQDGYQDLAVVADFESSQLYWNDGDGTFTRATSASGVGTEQNGMGNAFADYDGDGLLDWFVTAIDCDDDECELGGTGNRLYRNNGDRTFRDDTDRAGVRHGRWGWGAAFLDYDNDGDADLVMTNGMDFLEPAGEPFRVDPMRLFRNELGTMTEVSEPAGMTDRGNGKGLLVFDYDADGDLDVFVARRGQTGLLYRNDGGNEQSYLRVRLRGTVSNADGFGARVTLVREAGATPAVQELIGGNHFLGQSEAVLHFGLGPSAAPVAELRVRFLGAEEDQILTDVPANQTVLVVEEAP